MLWYILSPLRGTTQPPRFSSNHPIRRAFYRHGKTTAQHWLVAMLVSVAIAMAFSYPTVFLGDNPTAGMTTFPRHVWTNAKHMNESEAQADLEIRQIWVHGSYMHALDKDVLIQGLAIQQSIIGEDIANLQQPPHLEADRKAGSQLALHSPLMYWNNSRHLIESDRNVLETINTRRANPSSLNVVLRPASVFAGKRFERQRLLAADALVITLMNKLDGGQESGKWTDSMGSLVTGACENCTLYPPNGQVTFNRTFEFSFMPLSLQEHVALTIAYSAMALYVLLSLRRIKAFHSRFGLVVTAITQMTCSILASFTICGLLTINLAMIPQNAYPFVVLVLGVENMFRLINAVLAYPPTMATEMRIANALGDIGPISVAAAAQNLLILSLLSTVVSPGVAAFCVFAAIATLFDVFFLLTFFVAVLNVDIRRLELQDALVSKQNHPRHRRRASPSQHTWFDALLQGRLPFSTRMAGTAVTTTFILSLNYHFFERQTKSTGFRDLLGLVRGNSSSLTGLNDFAPSPVNGSLAPGEWMRMQDFDTAKEIMKLAKPGSDSFAVRMYTPLVVVLSGADRSDTTQVEMAWTQAMRMFALHHFYPVAVAVVFAVAFVAVLMNFLLYNEAGDAENERDLEELDEALETQSIILPHKLDVVKIAKSETGHFVTASLDRTIAISIADRSQRTYSTTEVPSHVLKLLRWPIRNLAIDDSGEWVAWQGADNQISAYNATTGSLSTRSTEYPDNSAAVLFGFMSLPHTMGNRLWVVALSSLGKLVMVSASESALANSMMVTDQEILAASFVQTSASGRQLIVVTDHAKIVSLLWSNSDQKWLESTTGTVHLPTLFEGVREAIRIETHSDHDSDIIMICSAVAIAFIDRNTLSHLGSLDFTSVAPFSEVMLQGLGMGCPSCGGLVVQKVAIANEGFRQDGLGVMTWSAGADDEACVCLAQRSATCHAVTASERTEHSVVSPGAWTAVKSHSIFGFRRRRRHDTRSTASKFMPDAPATRRRGHAARRNTQAHDEGEEWEAYKLSIDGDFVSIEVPDVSPDTTMTGDAGLYVDTPGPIVALDSQTVAVAFGNAVQIVRISRRGSGTRHAGINSTTLERQSSTSRKRTALRRSR